LNLQLKRIVAIGVITAAWTTDVLRAQTLNPPARGVIDMSRALTTSEIAQVLLHLETRSPGRRSGSRTGEAGRGRRSSQVLRIVATPRRIRDDVVSRRRGRCVEKVVLAT